MFKFMLSVWCLLQTLCIVGAVENRQFEPEYISLGSFCSPAMQLRSAGLRKAAYPLDWVLSIDSEKLIELINNDFAGFLDEQYIFAHPTNGILQQSRYHIAFSHEGAWAPSQTLEYMQHLASKYPRRIQRFRQLNEPGRELIFLRSAWPLSTHANNTYTDANNLEISVDYAVRLYDTLQRYFSQATCKLIILNPKQEGEIDRYDRIGNICMCQCYYVDLAHVAELMQP